MTESLMTLIRIQVGYKPYTLGEFDQESPDSQRDKNHWEDQAFEFKWGEGTLNFIW